MPPVGRIILAAAGDPAGAEPPIFTLLGIGLEQLNF
jgi:hypothetical protein